MNKMNLDIFTLPIILQEWYEKYPEDFEMRYMCYKNSSPKLSDETVLNRMISNMEPIIYEKWEKNYHLW